MAELRPCPFCGKQPRLKNYGLKTNSPGLFDVECANAQCGIMPELSELHTEAEAIAAWNARPEDAVREALEAVLNYHGIDRWLDNPIVLDGDVWGVTKAALLQARRALKGSRHPDDEPMIESGLHGERNVQ